MPSAASSRIREAIDALPIGPGVRVLEVGCGPGVAAREIVRRWPTAHVLGIDRSAKAIAQAIAGSQAELKAGQVAFRQVSCEEFELLRGERPYDFAFALRVGALDGRHPELAALAVPRLLAAVKKPARVFIDGGSPLRMLGAA